ncbi:MAG: type IV conjugative transfer system protein TraE [Candidatus Puniceispirillum sp.]|nr:type IV conjugative transfer system protein TraE [Candidatus Puniceispirillum sp.]
MKSTLFNARLSHVLYQRKILLITVGALLCTNLILSVGVFSKNERIVLVPPEIHGPLWVEKGRVSKTYLEEIAVFFAQMLLNATPKSLPYNHDLLLRYTAPGSYGTMKATLAQEARKITKDGLSTAFHPKHINANPEKMSAEITGELMGFVGTKVVFQKEEKYSIRLGYEKGRLMILEFITLEEKKNA